MPNKFFAFTMDVECDKGPNWISRKPFTFKNISEDLANKFHPFLIENNCIPTYLISPEVLYDHDSKKHLASLEGEYELGTHLHGEYVEPNSRFDAEGTYEFQCDYDEKIEYLKVQNLTRLFFKSFGYNPTSFRAGRYGISKFTVSILESLNYRVDSSVTPFKWWGSKINFLSSPVFPYFPSRYNYLVPGDSKILELPVSVYPAIFKWTNLTARKFINPHKYFFPILWSITNKFMDLKPKMLYPCFSSLNDMYKIVRWYDNLYEKFNKDIVLVMTCHSCELRIGASPYVLSKQYRREFYEKTKKIIKFVLQKGFLSASLTNIANRIHIQKISL
jgi:hypothetical protein